MPRLLRSIKWYIGSLAAIKILVCGLASAGTNLETVEMIVKPRKSAILPGEPLAVDVQIANRGDQPITIDLGYDAIEAFWFEISDSAGQSICTSEPISRFGISRSGRRTLQPGETITEEPLVMNMWCSSMLPPGEYTVTVNWDTRPIAEIQLRGRETFDLTILPADDQRLSSLLEKLKDDALNTDVAARDRRVSTQMLLNSDAPAAVHPIREFLRAIRAIRTIERQLFGMQAVEALGRIKTVESVRALTEIALSPGQEDDDRLATHAVRMVYQIHDSAVDAPQLRQACQPVMQARPRPAPLGRVID